MICLTLAVCLFLSTSARFVDTPPPVDLNPLLEVVASEPDQAVQLDLLNGMLDAVSGRRRMPMPSSWPEVYPKLAESKNPAIRATATRLALVFGDPRAFQSLRNLAARAGMPLADRVSAIESLVQARDGNLAPLLQGLLADPDVRAASLRGLAAVDDAETVPLILKTYPSLTPAERADALGTLASRPSYAMGLLDAIDRGAIPRNEVSASALQALAAHTDPKVKAGLARIWGVVRPTSKEKKQTIERLKAELTPSALATANRGHGRSVFTRHCASCHQLFGEGGKIGPELTGSQRANLDYVLSNVVDPSANVGRDYQVSVFATEDGRVVSGIVKREDDRSVSVQTVTDLVVIPKVEIESRRVTKESMMPEGLINALKAVEIRDLVAYLASPTQVDPAPEVTSDRRAR